jgi:hypothetical protein
MAVLVAAVHFWALVAQEQSDKDLMVVQTQAVPEVVHRGVVAHPHKV